MTAGDKKDLMMDSAALLGVLKQAGQLLDWEGEGIVPEGPEEALIDYMADHLHASGPIVLALLHSFRQTYGAGLARIRRQVERYSAAVEKFVEHFGPGPIALGRAPARINILGEHVDYVRYLPTEVLPFASREHDMLILFRPTENGVIRGRSTHESAEPATFSLAEGPRCANAADGPLEDCWLAYLREIGTPPRHWINYVKAGVFFCAAKHANVQRGFDFLLDSTIPAAGGASSSSTIVVLCGAAIRIVNDIPFDPKTLADDSAKAEWFIGTRGGNMDHCTMCLSQRQHALHMNFSPFKTELVPLHRYRYRWVTFFAHPADKSGDILLEYNERSAVSRLMIPALLDRMLAADSELKQRWERVVKTLSENTSVIEPAEEAREILSRLPECVTLAQVRRDFPAVYKELERSYPRLAEQTGSRPLVVRARALHHVGEVVRVREAVRIFNELFSSRMPEKPETTEPGLRAVGDLLTESHESMRDLYGLTTPHIDELVEIILSHPGVYGARLMGGGFGGNILALISKEHLAELVAGVQARYYAPRGRDGVAEGAIMVSTPGEGFGMLSLTSVLRQAVINASAVWWKWDRYAPVMEKCVCDLLGTTTLSRGTNARLIQPVIVAGGRGEVKLDSDYRSPWSLNVFNGKTSLETVLDTISSLQTLPPIVVISPAMRGKPMANVTLPSGAKIAVQTKPLGTGDAVRAALDQVPDDADVLVTWGSQPLISAGTLAESVTVFQALGSAAMLFPTAVTRTPYAPIQRDLHGYVIASRETAAEGAPTKRLGETNVGAFVLDARTLKTTLTRIHEKLWDARAKRYATKSGDLGFPNEMARELVSQGKAVIALPIARVEESFGLRTLAGYEEVKRIIAAKKAEQA